MESAGIYIHIPFCVRKCLYCDFVSAPGSAGMIQTYLDALCREISLTAEILPERAYRTVFFGGGTPSLMTGEQLKKVMRTLRTHFLISSDAEVTMECNPGTLTEKKLEGYIEAGVNRLSVGLQSADDAILRSIGRIHDYSDFQRTVELIRKAEMDNFNVDIMHGLPGQDMETYLDTIRKAADTGATHISAYGLILEEGTALFQRVNSGEAFLPDPDETADMQDAGIDLLEEYGFHRYEISNFARSGRQCRHNLNYWKNGEYAGFGIAAHSAMRRDGWIRWANGPELPRYISALEEGGLPEQQMTRIGIEEEMFESIMLGLRMIRGVEITSFSKRFGISPLEKYREPVQELRNKRWLNESLLEEGFLALNRRGLDLQNPALELFMN